MYYQHKSKLPPKEWVITQLGCIRKILMSNVAESAKILKELLGPITFIPITSKYPKSNFLIECDLLSFRVEKKTKYSFDWLDEIM
jgi:hypothetical protein